MRTAKLIAAACLLGLAACGGAGSPYPSDTSAILEGEQALALADQCSRIEPGPVDGAWTPSEADIRRLEAGLPAVFEENANLRWPDDGLAALDYYRQYGGLIVGGRQIIYVNGVQKRVIEDGERYGRPHAWREGPIQVCDGGPIVFGVEYDRESGTFANFAFNGAL